MHEIHIYLKDSVMNFQIFMKHKNRICNIISPIIRI